MTVEDPDGRIKGSYRVFFRPQTYFVDRDGILRTIQLGKIREPDFDRK